MDSSGNAYVAGTTCSSDFPTVNAFQGSFASDEFDGDVFVTKLAASGSALVYSTYLGGSGTDIGKGIAVDSSGNAYVTGTTYSSDFPTANAFLGTFKGNAEAFVTKLNTSGNALVYSTYLGGNNGARGGGIAVDSSDNAYVTGYTSSSDFPTVNAFQDSRGSNIYHSDAFVTKLNASGNALVYSTYLGGSNDDGGSGIALDSSGNAYVTGFAASPDFPTANAFQGTLQGELDIFIAKIGDVPCTLVPKFQKATLQNGMTYYTDRSYTFTSVPSQYVGMEMIKSPNDDRSMTCDRGYMSFAMPADGLVYVGYDQRATTLPDWLNGFTDTGDIINTSLDSQGWLKVYSKQFIANECVDLGCNKGTGFTSGTVSNYCVFYGTVTPVSCVLEEPKFQRTTVQNGMTYYTDRSYTFTSVPSQYVGLDMVKAPNNDRNMNCASGYMSFVMPADGTVYVGYDRRAATLPEWLSGFTDTGEIINTSLGTQGWLKVYSKQFTANECVDFGCNKGTGFTGGTVSNYCVFYGTGTPVSCILEEPKFQKTTAQNGMTYYTDRSYTFTSVPPQYVGLDMIKAPNNDRNMNCASGYMSFVIPADGTVYVGYDRRAATLPDWLSGFTDTGEIINTSLGTQGWLKVYSKQFAANECVDLGCNKGTGFTGGTVSNYCVFYGTGTPVSCILEEPKLQKTTVQNGMTYYTDRSYTFTSVPSQYVGLDMIKAPNNDRNMNCASGYMSFVIPADGTVYVGYDRRAATLPDWLSGFTDTGEIINTSLGTQGWLKVYSKQFTANECVDFGCNKGTGFSGGTVSNYVVFTD